MAKFTLFEVHLDGATLTANAPFSSQSGPDDAEDESEGAREATDLGEEETDGRSVAPLVVALVALVVVAVVVKKLVGGSEDVTDDVPE